MKILLLPLLLLASGCGNFVRAYGDPVELARKDCLNIGHRGVAYTQCVDRISQQIREQRSRERAAANSAPVIRPQHYGPDWRVQPQPQIQYHHNRTITCTPRLGGRIDCS